MDIELTMTNNTQDPNDISMTKQTGIGARLKSAREAMHLTEKEAALKLHLSVKFIEMMEKEDFENGPPVTFMRGYLRSYARMLDLSQKEINTAIEQLGMNTPAAAIISPVLNTPLTNDVDRYARWGTYLIILILAVLVGIWWTSRSTDTTSAEQNKSLPQPAAVTNTTKPVTNVTNNLPRNTNTNVVTPPLIVSPGPSIPAPKTETPLPATPNTEPSAQAPAPISDAHIPATPMEAPRIEAAPIVTPGNATINNTNSENGAATPAPITNNTAPSALTPVPSPAAVPAPEANVNMSNSTRNSTPESPMLMMAPAFHHAGANKAAHKTKSKSGRSHKRYKPHMRMSVPEPGLF